MQRGQIRRSNWSAMRTCGNGEKSGAVRFTNCAGLTRDPFLLIVAASRMASGTQTIYKMSKAAHIQNRKTSPPMTSYEPLSQDYQSLTPILPPLMRTI